VTGGAPARVDGVEIAFLDAGGVERRGPLAAGSTSLRAATGQRSAVGSGTASISATSACALACGRTAARRARHARRRAGRSRPRPRSRSPRQVIAGGKQPGCHLGPHLPQTRNATLAVSRLPVPGSCPLRYLLARRARRSRPRRRSGRSHAFWMRARIYDADSGGATSGALFRSARRRRCGSTTYLGSRAERRPTLVTAFAAPAGCR
jgi:hypothetical protein